MATTHTKAKATYAFITDEIMNMAQSANVLPVMRDARSMGTWAVNLDSKTRFPFKVRVGDEIVEVMGRDRVRYRFFPSRQQNQKARGFRRRAASARYVGYRKRHAHKKSLATVRDRG